jgi:hypothetical protein
MEAQPRRVSSSIVSPCYGCSLRVDSVATVGGGEDPAAYFTRPAFNAALINDRLLIGATTPVQIFTLKGEFGGVLGRSGQGPGEFPSWITGIASGPNRSLHVFVGPQVVIFDSTLQFERKVTLAHGSLRPVVLSDGSYAGLARMPPTRGGGPPTAGDYKKVVDGPLFELFSRDGKYIRSVGATLSLADEIIAAGSGATVWTGKRAPYELKQWSQDGTLLRVFERITPAFDSSPYIGPWPYVPGRGPRARLLDVRQDSDGRLWTAFSVRKGGADLSVLTDSAVKQCCETVIEVLDPQTGTLLGTTRIAHHVFRLLDRGYIVAGASGENGEPLAIIFVGRLTVPKS